MVMEDARLPMKSHGKKIKDYYDDFGDTVRRRRDKQQNKRERLIARQLVKQEFRYANT